jgi:nucleoside-diphosphate-sugar epimerase
MRRIFITGAAGYVGAMLVDQFSKRDDVEAILGLDREPVPELIASNPKLTYIQANLEDMDWQREAHDFKPDTVIHTAWQIRMVYGHPEKSWIGNIEGSDNAFEFAFGNPHVRKLVYFSTVASYGAFKDNPIDHYFKEEEVFRKTKYMYAEEKRIVEERLKNLYDKSDKKTQVFIVRPAAITGPRGRYMRIRFGLQSALSGMLKGSFVYNVVNKLVFFVPATRKWLRQFVHEDDVNDIVEKLVFDEVQGNYEAFNLAPPGATVRPADMGKAVGKKVVYIHPYIIRVAFFIFWHLTRGKIPTSKGAWKGYSYPIAVSGEKVTKHLGYEYKHNSLDAFTRTTGRYESYAKSV